MEKEEETLTFEDNSENIVEYTGTLDIEISNFKVNGSGTLKFKTYSITGKIINNQLDGKGILENANHIRYSGEFKKSIIQGFGCQSIQNVVVQYGNYLNGVEEGNFTKYDIKNAFKQVICFDHGRSMQEQEKTELSDQELELLTSVQSQNADFMDICEQLQQINVKSLQSSIKSSVIDDSARSPSRKQYLMNLSRKMTESAVSDAQQALQTSKSKVQQFKTQFDSEYTVFDGEIDTTTNLGHGCITYVKEHPEGFLKFTGETASLNEFHQITGNGDLVKKASDGEKQYTVSGAIVNGYLQGTGRRVDDDGTVYEGEFENSLLNGYGKIIEPTGEIFEGRFKDGLEHGEVVVKTTFCEEVCIYDHGDVVQLIKTNKIPAKLVATSSINEDFALETKDTEWYSFDGQKIGETELLGKLRFAQSETYKWFSGRITRLRLFNNNLLLSGTGELLKRNRNGAQLKLNGEIVDNELFSNGRVEFENGDVYVGSFERSKLNGYGSARLNSGDFRYRGSFVNNQLVRGEVVDVKKRVVQKGQFEGGFLIQGEISTDTYIIKGTFKDGKLINGQKHSKKTQYNYIFENAVLTELQTDLYVFRGEFDGKSPRSGMLTFKPSTLNEQFKFVSFQGVIEEINKIFITGNGTLTKYDQKDRLYTVVGQIQRGFLYGRGERINEDAVMTGYFIESLLHGYGEITFNQKNVTTCGQFEAGILVDGETTNQLTNELIETVRKRSDGQTLVKNSQYEFLGKTRQHLLTNGIIVFSEDAIAKTGIKEAVGDVCGQLSCYQYVVEQ